MEYLIYFLIWWGVGFILVQMGNFFANEGIFSKFEDWTLDKLAADFAIALIGVFIIFILMMSFGETIVIKRAKGEKND